MAKTGTSRNGQAESGHKAYWKQPWAQRVLKGNYNSFEKLLFMRIASFGADGCWMKNQTLATEIGCCERYVREGIANLWKGREFWITGWDSTKRRIYAHHNPEVKAMAEERYQAELKAGTVKDKRDFYIKNKTRGYKTPQKHTELEANNPEPECRVKTSTRNHSAGYPEQECRVGGTRVPGYPEQECRVHISKSRERTKEQELRQADTSSPTDRQPNPPAKEAGAGDSWADMEERVLLSHGRKGPQLTEAEIMDRKKRQSRALMTADALDGKGGKA